MKNKKIISMMVTLLLVWVVLMGNTLTALAATTVLTKDNIQTLQTFNNYEKNKKYHVSGMGGLSVGESNGKTFVLKCDNEKEKVSILYYYTNINDKKAKPKRIVFKDTILGHANAMAIDQEYLYVTKWSHKSGKEENQATIVKISRSAINTLPDMAEIVYGDGKYNQNSKINKKLIYTQFEFKIAGTNTYYGKNKDEKITAITKYRYSKGDKTTTTKFLVNYLPKRDSSSASYTIATVEYDNTSGKVNSATISTADKDIFRIKLPEPTKGNSTEKKTYTYQDIYYKKEYGLFIAVWHRGDYDTDSDKTINKEMKKRHNLNTIYRVNIDGHSEADRAKKTQYTDNDMKNLELDMSGYSNYYKYEIESLSFIKWTDGTYRIIFSANVADKTNAGTDVVARVKKTIKSYDKQK